MTKKHKKILIIEDESMLQEALIENFSAEGYEVRGCSNATKAFELMREDKPDMILTDLVLPNIDGFEILRTLRESVDLMDIPIIVLSNSGDEENVKKAKELGAHNFLIKSNLSLTQVTESVTKAFSEFVKK